MKNTIKIEGKKYILSENAEFEYRSHINGMQALRPNNWISCECTDEEGNVYKAWYLVEDTNIELDSINYNEPDDITDEFGKLIYCK